MKLFIFKPSRFWEYCNGMVIVTAPSFIEACKKLQKKNNDRLDDDDIKNEMKFTQTDFSKKPLHYENQDV